MTVVTNTVHISQGQFTYSTEAEMVLRYRILWRTTFERRQHASVTQLKDYIQDGKLGCILQYIIWGQVYYYRN